MKKSTYFLFFLIALILFSINFIFQKNPGYMDSEYYFLGGKYLSENQIKANFIWNYLDNPNALPYPMFSYWMPFASIITWIPMALSKMDSFQISRIGFLILSSIFVPWVVFIAYKITSDRFIAIISGFLALFNGFYFKFITIPETILPYLFLGSIFFFLSYLIFKHDIDYLFGFLGFISGLLHITRVDGNLFIGFSIILLFYSVFNHIKTSKKNLLKKIIIRLFYCLLGYFIPLIPYIGFMKTNFGTFSSPVGIKALWINIYDDTFVYPASKLNFSYWISGGVVNKLATIWKALKMNLGTLAAVQLNIFGVPLIILGVWKNISNKWLKFFLFAYLSIFFIMTVLFPFAGSRGGFLHSGAAFQSILWILIADGFNQFLIFGVKNRGWKNHRAKKMFTPAILIFCILFSSFVYFKDVIGPVDGYIWNQDYQRYDEINQILNKYDPDKKYVVMINNPVGFHYSTTRKSIVIPNAEKKDFETIITKFDVKFLVVDNNIPIALNGYINVISSTYIEIGTLPEYDLKIYEVQ